MSLNTCRSFRWTVSARAAFAKNTRAAVNSSSFLMVLRLLGSNCRLRGNRNASRGWVVTHRYSRSCDTQSSFEIRPLSRTAADREAGLESLPECFFKHEAPYNGLMGRVKIRRNVGV